MTDAKSFDTYWHELVERVHAGDPLTATEQVFHALSAIRGDLFSGGLAGYFERQFMRFDQHARILEMHGFKDVAAHLHSARDLLFGDSPLTQETVDEGVERYLDLPDDDPVSDKLQDILDQLYPRCDDIEDYRDQLGLREGFYERLE